MIVAGKFQSKCEKEDHLIASKNKTSSTSSSTAFIRHEAVNFIQHRRTNQSTRAVKRHRHQRETHKKTKLRKTPTRLGVTHSMSRNRRAEALDRLSVQLMTTTTTTIRSNDDDDDDNKGGPVVTHNMWNHPPLENHFPKGRSGPSFQLVPLRVSTRSIHLTTDQTKVHQHELDMAHRREALETKKVMHEMDKIRSTISSFYIFTPLFRIWSKYKTLSALLSWRAIVDLDREREEHLFQLIHYAVTIQRKFRERRRGQQGRLRRQLRLAEEERAVLTLQCWIRNLFRELLGRKTRELKGALCIQAVWHGRVARIQVKDKLKQVLRARLQYLSPTGSLHRLDAISASSVTLQSVINRSLSLVIESPVALGKAKVEAREDRKTEMISYETLVTRRSLLDAMADLDVEIRKREAHMRQVKHDVAQVRWRKLETTRLDLEAAKHQALVCSQERLARVRECDEMQEQDRDMQTLERVSRRLEADTAYRNVKLEREREGRERSQMEKDEFERRHLLARVRVEAEERQRRVSERTHVQTLKIRVAEAALELRCRRQMELEEKYQIVAHVREQEEVQAREKWMLQSMKDMEAMTSRLEEKQLAFELRQAQATAEEERQERERERELAKVEEKRRVAALEREARRQERRAMARDETQVKQQEALNKKQAEVLVWQRYTQDQESCRTNARDPLYRSNESQIESEEEERRRWERQNLAREEGLTREWLEHQHKIERRRQARERQKRLDRERRLESLETKGLSEEDARSNARETAERRAVEHARILSEMKIRAEAEATRVEHRRLEAKSRRLMRDEELAQRRVETLVRRRFRQREEKERKNMIKEELDQRQFEALVEALRQWKCEKRARRDVMMEDLRSSKWNELERDGRRLDQILWQPEEAISLSHYVEGSGQYLRQNVQALVQRVPHLRNEESPLSFDTEHLALSQISRESQMRQCAEIMARWLQRQLPMVQPQVQSPAQRWKASVSKWHLMRQAHLAEAHESMGKGQLYRACGMYQRLVNLGFQSMTFFRTFAQVLYQTWLKSADRYYLDQSYIYYRKCSYHMALLRKPDFLNEIAHVLVDRGQLQLAAENFGKIISIFSNYEKLHDVIFDAGHVLFQLKVYDQSCEYLLHVLEDPPRGWNSWDIMFMVSRGYDLGGKKKMMHLGYEESFKTNTMEKPYKFYYSWKEWLGDPITWSEMGDRYYHDRLFGLAKDAFQQALKRKEANEELVLDNVWQKLAICQYYLRDKKGMRFALKNWLAIKSYDDRISEKMERFSPEFWHRLGIQENQVMKDTRNVIQSSIGMDG